MDRATMYHMATKVFRLEPSQYAPDFKMTRSTGSRQFEVMGTAQIIEMMLEKKPSDRYVPLRISSRHRSIPTGERS